MTTRRELLVAFGVSALATPLARLRMTLLTLGLLLSGATLADATLWRALATESNVVVFIRHANAAGGHPLRWDDTGRCEGETILTPNGRQQARKIGAAFARAGVKPGAVISSPMCRCHETAVLAFGGDPVRHPELREIANADRSRTAAFERAALALIGKHLGRTPVVFVSHRPNIELLTLELIAEEELLVARVTGKGNFDVLGKLRIGP